MSMMKTIIYLKLLKIFQECPDNLLSENETYNTDLLTFNNVLGGQGDKHSLEISWNYAIIFRISSDFKSLVKVNIECPGILKS